MQRRGPVPKGLIRVRFIGDHCANCGHVAARDALYDCGLPAARNRSIASPNGGTLDVGEQGELLARGYMVMKG
jgi:hypothetical protein